MSEKLLLLAVFVISMLLMAGNYKRKRKKIVFFEDLITNKRFRAGYITHLLQLLKEGDIEYKYDLVSAGADVNTVTDRLSRVDTDILSEGADIVVIFIGVHDVAKKISGGQTSEKEFEAVYKAIIEKLDAVDVKIILCTPVVIGEGINLTNEQDNDLEKYSEIIRDISAKYNLPLADLRKAFLADNLLNIVDESQHSILAVDPVHLSHRSNQLAAAEIWKALQHVMEQ